ncbi:MAG: hypothetical protein JW860_09240 [Sedimentisphaerales bacterium]|nr:hypothetical protein [Sedimentisphaerales bacterium]
MEYKYLGLFLVLAAFFAGCEDAEMARLKEESPFKVDQPADPDRIIFVTCNYLPLELPGHVDVEELVFWRRNSFDPAERENNAGVESGFDTNMLRSWEQNGFILALAPIDQWQRFVEELDTLGAIRMPGRTALFRNARQVAEVFSYIQEVPTSVFVNDAGGRLRGYSLTNGECLFQVNCVPTEKKWPVESLYVKLAPMFRSPEYDGRVVQDEEYDQIRLVREPREVIFEQMTLAGRIKRGYFLVIAVKQNEAANNLGKLFLARSRGAEDYQLVFLLTPDALNATEVKNRSE